MTPRERRLENLLPRERRLEELLRCCLVKLYEQGIAEELREEIETELAKEKGGY